MDAERPFIYWDVDDVLNDLMRCWFVSWRRENPGCAVSYDQLVANPPQQILGISLDEYLASLDRFRLSSEFMEMQPLSEVLEWFKVHGNRFNHAALTAVPRCAVQVSSHWVFMHFGDWIRSYHFIPSRRLGESLPQYDSSKSEILARCPCSLFIDDNEENIRLASAAGIACLLFPRPWNSGRKKTISQTLQSISEIYGS